MMGMDNEWIFNHLAAIALEEGDLRPLIARVKRRKTLTEAEWTVIEQVLEAAAAGRRGWRPPKRPKMSEVQTRRQAYGVIYHFYHRQLAYASTWPVPGGQPVIVCSREDAVKFVAQRYRLGTSRVEQYLGIARRDPLIMGDGTIKGMVDAFARAVTKEEWEARPKT